MLVILVLSTFLALQSGGNALQIIFVFLKMVAFLAGSVAFGLWILPRISRYVSRLPISQGLVTLSLIIMLVYGVSAELFGGMAAITGAFIAGLMFSRTREKVEIERGLRAVAYSFFVPIFFVNIGLSVNIRDLDISALIVMLVISVAAILGKLIGSGLGAKLGDFSWRESLQLGEVGLIVAAVGLEAGLISPNLFSAIIGMVLITTLVTPPMLRASFAKPATPLQPPANIA
jgi:Kef-type K+ transport system membrane component KefB